MKQLSNDKRIKKISRNGKNLGNVAIGLLLLAALVAGGMMGCQKQDAPPQEKQETEAKQQAQREAYIKEQLEAGNRAIRMIKRKEWSRAKTAAENILKVAPDNASAQELKRVAYWAPLPEKISGNLRYKVHPTQPVCLFSGCIKRRSVTTLVLPESIEGKKVIRLGWCAFDGCSSLTSVTIPSSVTSIGDGAFAWCRSLTAVTIPPSVTSIGGRAFSQCSVLKSMTIPSSVTSIGEKAFYGCRGLKSVTIPSSVTSIEKCAFAGCSGLTSVTIPKGVTSIGDGAFSECRGLTSVTIPSSVTSIGNNAFSYCKGLTSVTMPKGVKMGARVFYGCPWQPGQ